MILLDTNVLSAIMQPVPELSVAAWMDGQPRSAIWTSSISVFEIEYGLNLMSIGKRRSHLETVFAALLGHKLHGQIADFDPRAATEAGRVMARRKREGRDSTPQDAMIAGIAITRRATIATRNTKHFEDLPLTVINPWQA